jgi:hypothetical protein
MEARPADAMKDDSTLAFLAAHARKSKEPIAPLFRHGHGVTYEIEGVDISAERIKAYEQEKFLSVAGWRPFPACPRCTSLLLAIQLNCPDCKKASIARSEIMIHYECEYSGPVDEFVSHGGSEYVCPKCSKTLKKVGIEYGKPGIGFKCQECGRVFQYPLVNMACQGGHTSKIDELDLKPFPVYRVNDEIQGFADVADYFLSIQKALAASRIEAEVLARIKGQSGVMHIIPLAIKTQKANAVVDFILKETGSDSKVLQKVLRSADLGRYMTLLFVPQALVSQLSSIVNPDRVRLLAIPAQNDPDAVAREVIKVVG